MRCRLRLSVVNLGVLPKRDGGGLGDSGRVRLTCSTSAASVFPVRLAVVSLSHMEGDA
jgi:hypothetical protein